MKASKVFNIPIPYCRPFKKTSQLVGEDFEVSDASLLQLKDVQLLTFEAVLSEKTNSKKQQVQNTCFSLAERIDAFLLARGDSPGTNFPL